MTEQLIIETEEKIETYRSYQQEIERGIALGNRLERILEIPEGTPVPELLTILRDMHQLYEENIQRLTEVLNLRKEHDNNSKSPNHIEYFFPTLTKREEAKIRERYTLLHAARDLTLSIGSIALFPILGIAAQITPKTQPAAHFCFKPFTRFIYWQDTKTENWKAEEQKRRERLGGRRELEVREHRILQNMIQQGWSEQKAIQIMKRPELPALETIQYYAKTYLPGETGE